MREESNHVGLTATVFQAEVFAVGRAAKHLPQFNVSGRNITINYDSQATILALDSHIIKTNSILKAVQALKNLADSTQVFLRWIPAHQGPGL